MEKSEKRRGGPGEEELLKRSQRVQDVAQEQIMAEDFKGLFEEYEEHLIDSDLQNEFAQRLQNAVFRVFIKIQQSETNKKIFAGTVTIGLLLFLVSAMVLQFTKGSWWWLFLSFSLSIIVAWLVSSMMSPNSPHSGAKLQSSIYIINQEYLRSLVFTYLQEYEKAQTLHGKINLHYYSRDKFISMSRKQEFFTTDHECGVDIGLSRITVEKILEKEPQLLWKFQQMFERGEETYRLFNQEFNSRQAKSAKNSPTNQISYTAFSQLKTLQLHNPLQIVSRFPWKYDNNSHLMVTTIENGLEVIKTESEFFFVSETYPVLLPAEDEASYIPGVIKSVQELNTAKNAKEIEARPRCPAGTKYLEKHDHKAKRKIDEIMQQYNNVNPDEYKLSVDDRDLKVYTKVYTGPEKEPLIFQKCFLFFENTPSEVVFKFIDDLKFRNRWDKSMLGKVVVEEVENTKIIRGIFPGKYMVSDREFLFKTTAFYKVQQFDYFLQIAACEHPDYPEKDDLIRARILLQGQMIEGDCVQVDDGKRRVGTKLCVIVSVDIGVSFQHLLTRRV